MKCLKTLEIDTQELANEIASGNYGLIRPEKEDARLIAEIIQIIAKDNMATNHATYILDTAKQLVPFFSTISISSLKKSALAD